MRIFGSDRMDGMLQKLGLKEDEAIVHPWINKAIEKAQQKVEARNFDIRKNILKYDNVMNDQRKVVFEQRKRVHGARRACARRSTRCATASSTTSSPATSRQNAYAGAVGRRGPEGGRSRTSSTSTCRSTTGRRKRASPTRRSASACARRRTRPMRERVEKNSSEVMTYVEKQVLLQSLDHLWREHLVTLDHLRQVIGWRGYAQRDPLNEYKSEAFELFNELVGHLREQVTGAAHARSRWCSSSPSPSGLPPMFAQHLDPATGENEFGYRQGSGSFGGAGPALGFRRRRSPAPTRGARARPERPLDLGPGRPQRALPLRLRQEVQALPRAVRVAGPRLVCSRVTYRLRRCPRS